LDYPSSGTFKVKRLVNQIIIPAYY
jgi:hypothetical protein